MPLLVAQATGAIARAENRPLLYTTKTPSSLDLFQTLFASNDSPVLCMQNCTSTSDSVSATRRILDWLLDSSAGAP